MKSIKFILALAVAFFLGCTAVSVASDKYIHIGNGTDPSVGCAWPTHSGNGSGVCLVCFTNKYSDIKCKEALINK